MKEVCVLLAAYNGEKYLEEQVDSILSQKGVRVSLLARDDASDDRTGEILAAYARKYGNVSVYAGKRKGAAGSFYDLLAHTDASADYYAFADQDDVWLEGKLARALQLLEKEKGKKGLPLLYAGKVIYASADLKKQKAFPYQIRREASFGNALVENICMGCTQVFNRPLLRLARERLPGEDIMHDWWMYLTASCFGRVIYDRQAHMLYRQHGGNQIGMQASWGARWKNRALHAARLRHKLSGQAAAFRETYGGLLDGTGMAYREACGEPPDGAGMAYREAYGGLPDGAGMAYREACGEPLDGTGMAYREAYGGLPNGAGMAYREACGEPPDGAGMAYREACGEPLGCGKHLDSLELLCGYRGSVYKRISLALDRRIYRQNRMDDFLYRLLFLAGYL